MKAPINLSTAIQKFALIAAFISIATLVYPETMFAAYAAQDSNDKALVFEISSKQNSETTNFTDGLRYDELVASDPLVSKVKAYLESKGSPLAEYSAEIVQQPQWQRALAISFVESNFGKHCFDNNCSGIGVHPKHPSWRKYETKLDWFKDMSALLERPIYKEKFTTCAKMRGVYVVPGSAGWVNGCNKVTNELVSITQDAQQEKFVLAQNSASDMSIATLAMNILK